MSGLCCDRDTGFAHVLSVEELRDPSCCFLLRFSLSLPHTLESLSPLESLSISLLPTFSFLILRACVHAVGRFVTFGEVEKD